MNGSSKEQPQKEQRDDRPIDAPSEQAGNKPGRLTDEQAFEELRRRQRERRR